MEKFLPLLQDIEVLSASRERHKLLTAFLSALVSLLGDEVNFCVFCRSADEKKSFRPLFDPVITYSGNTEWLGFVDEPLIKGEALFERIHERQCAALWLHSSLLTSEQLVLVYELGGVNPKYSVEAVNCLARIYANQIKLLDYSELDSLTGLLNRKTFDERFDRLLEATFGDHHDAVSQERRSLGDENKPDAHAWLCVIDVDFFKRVNDEFGHLFGDEVLLRMGDLLRKTFRDGDRLFRFGGEEFVVVLNAQNEKQAEIGFDRFRVAVENHEFPQVGKVTCSLGFTLVSEKDVPTDAVGRADEALYYAKRNGRNRSCCYEQLLACGAIEQVSYKSTQGLDDSDIDALFD